MVRTVGGACAALACHEDRTVVRAISVILVFGFAVSAPGAEPAIEFNRDVRPILSDRCFVCHGPDAGSRRADLRLDRRAAAVSSGVIVPRKPAESELIARITSDDDDERMPTAETGKPLSHAEQQILRQWIAQGAVWQEHWAWIPARRPAVPSIAHPERANGAIDRFILARLDRKKIEPVPRADRRTLIRRLSWDLTGLPPSPDQVAAFRHDESPQAYEQLVDRLLASPHYGERMAMYWLDLVRYADTLGYHGDQPRSVSPYRDYVIAALNANMPFDQFTRENLAGDLLPNATLSQRVASTYNRLNRASAEGGVQPKEYLAKYAADRVRTTGSVWLGVTLGCAQCHDHKFDPFTSKDFYRFAAFFADIKEQGIVPNAVHIEQLPVPTPEQQASLTAVKAKIARLKARLNERSPAVDKKFAAWQRKRRTKARRWSVLQPIKADSTAGATLRVDPDGAVLATGKNPDRDTYRVTVAAPLEKLTAIRLELLPDPSLPQQGPGRADNGNLVLQRFAARLGDRPIIWKSAAATHSQKDFGVEHLLDANQTKGWAILPRTGAALQAVLVAQQPIEPAPKAKADQKPTLVFELVQNHGTRHTVGRFRLYGTSIRDIDPKAEVRQGALLPGPIAAVLALKSDQRSAQQKEQLWKYFRDTSALLKPLRDELADLAAQQAAIEKSIVTTLATKAGKPRVTRVLPRGNWMDDSGEIVLPAVPAFLNTLPPTDRRLDRLDLARWLTRPDNPLTARTFVNRLWMLLFGRGLATTVDDLGSQGQWPTHPALLDWLAVEFVESGWDIKHMVKLMVMSNAYRRSSRPTPRLRRLDPDNRLLTRQGRWRIDAEMVRDNALMVSGLLVLKIGGPSVKPYQPAGYWSQLNFPKRVYKHDTGANQYRRGLYTHWQRTFLHPSLLAFDAPVREECTARRDRSNTPLQALVLLNDPTYVEAARVLAARIVRCSGSDVDARLRWTYNQVLARAPTADELACLGRLYRRNHDFYRAHPDDATKLIHTGLAPVDSALDPVDVAAWTSVARALLNLHETITRY